MSTPWLRLTALVLLALTVLVGTWSAGSPADAADPEAPGKPANLGVATEQGSLDVALDWDDVDGAIRYHVRWREAGSGNELNAGVVTATSQLDISVAGYGQWVTRVQACNDAGCGKPVTRKFRVEPAPEPETNTPAESTSEPDSQPAPPPALEVSISADPASPEVNQYATLSATIANIPFDSGWPSYNWQMQQDGGWNSVWTGPTFSYNSNAPVSVTFRLTVSYETGISDTSEPLTVTWTGDPPPVAVDPEPEPVIETIEVATADCELAPPEGVTALGVAKAAVAFWQAPSDDDACEPVGYLFEARNVNGGSWRSDFVRAEARSHVLEDLPPGQVEYHVTTIYPTGASDRPLALPQVSVPLACNLELTVEANIDRGISGTWSNRASMPAGCAVSLEIEYEYKESTWDHFRSYGRFNNHQRQNPNQPSFIAYGLKPDVTYDFRIVAVDAAGRKNESNVASATVVYDASATPDANSPRNLRVQPHNGSGAFVTWDAPTVASGRTLSGYVVEWQFGFTKSTATVAANVTRHGISGLTDGNVYTVRVAARTTGTSPATHDAWTAPSTPFTAWSEAKQIWFVDFDPGIHTTSRNVFMTTDSNHKRQGDEVKCAATSGGSTSEVNCPYGTGVSRPIGTNDPSVQATVTSTGGAQTSTSTHSATFGGPHTPRASASGGNGRLLVEWQMSTNRTWIGDLDAFLVQHRKQNADGSWPDWPTGEVKAASDRSHTFTGLANGTWQVQVRPRSANTEDHDGDPNTDPITVHRLGFNSEPLTVTLAIANHATPGRVTGATVTPGPGSLIAEWEPPSEDGAIVHAYQVRHRGYLASGYRSDDAGWTEGPVIYPRQTSRICTVLLTTICENPRSYEITGLIGGNRYDVAVRGKNAQGWGEWHFIGIRNVADGFTPVVQSAAVNAASLTLTFDRTIDTDSKPDPDAFTVTVNGTAQTPTAVGMSGSTVTLTLGTAVAKLSVVQVSYTRPDMNPLQHDDAPALSFTNRPVANNTP